MTYEAQVHQNIAEPLAESTLLRKDDKNPSTNHIDAAPETALSFMDLDSMPQEYSTFCRQLHRAWSHRLKFRTEGQHALCTDCARWKQRCKLGLQAHLSSMMADRRLDPHLNQLAAEAVTGAGCSDGVAAHLTMTIDAMDSSKFVLPRNLANMKQFLKLHKAEVKMSAVRWSRGSRSVTSFCLQGS